MCHAKIATNKSLNIYQKSQDEFVFLFSGYHMSVKMPRGLTSFFKYLHGLEYNLSCGKLGPQSTELKDDRKLFAHTTEVAGLDTALLHEKIQGTRLTREFSTDSFPQCRQA